MRRDCTPSIAEEGVGGPSGTRARTAGTSLATVRDGTSVSGCCVSILTDDAWSASGRRPSTTSPEPVWNPVRGTRRRRPGLGRRLRRRERDRRAPGRAPFADPRAHDGGDRRGPSAIRHGRRPLLRRSPDLREAGRTRSRAFRGTASGPRGARVGPSTSTSPGRARAPVTRTARSCARRARWRKTRSCRAEGHDGDGTACTSTACAPTQTGARCIPGACLTTTQAQCASLGGTDRGHGRRAGRRSAPDDVAPA